MKKPELKDSIATSFSIEELKKKIMDYFNQNSVNIKQWDDDIIIGIYGSRLKANFKGILADPSILPVKIALNLQENNTGNNININLQDYFLGFYPIGTKRKYIQILAHLMNNLKLIFYSNDSLEEIDKCPYCNKSLRDNNQKYCESCGYQLISVDL